MDPYQFPFRLNPKVPALVCTTPPGKESVAPASMLPLAGEIFLLWNTGPAGKLSPAPAVKDGAGHSGGAELTRADLQSAMYADSVGIHTSAVQGDE